MTTFRARTDCWIRRTTLTHDGYGREIEHETRRRAKCGVVWVKDGAQPTSVRVDSSASRGRADEHVSDVRLLFPPNTDVKFGDLVEVYGIVVKITSAFPRPDVAGRIHHIQVEGVRWA